MSEDRRGEVETKPNKGHELRIGVEFPDYSPIIKAVSGIEEQFAALPRVVGQMITGANIAGLMKPVSQAFVDLKASRSVAATFGSSLSLSGAATKELLSRLEHTQPLLDLGRIAGATQLISTQAETARIAANLSAISSEFGKSLASLSKTSLMVEAHLSGLSEPVLATLSTPMKQHISAPFHELSQSYAALISTVAEKPAYLRTFNYAIIEHPQIQYLNSAALLDTLAVDRAERRTSAEEQELTAEIDIDVLERLPDLLSTINPGFADMWRGAVDAFNSNNIDRIRHVMVSMRELFTQVIHTLAPDEAIREWSTSPTDFAGGRPTRAARLRFICRKIDHPPLDDFAEKNYAEILSISDLLQPGTHSVKFAISDVQLKVLVRRFGSALLFLVELA